MASIRVRRVYLGEGVFKINTFPNLTGALRAFEQKSKELLAAAAMATRHEAEYQLALTQEQVPVSTPEEAAVRGRVPGQLKASGRVQGPDLTAKYVMADIVYGGPAGSGPGQLFDVDYAVYVHEALYAHHEVGKAKFVEDIVRAERETGRMVERMSAEIKQRMGWA